VSGVVPVTGYVNSAYDNATRANGAVGANWTIGAGGINIAGNAFQGGTASVHKCGCGGPRIPFTNSGNFLKVTVLTLNGVTRFYRADGTRQRQHWLQLYLKIRATFFLQRYSGGTGTNLANTAIPGHRGM